MDTEVDIEEVKKCLQDAGLYEENLPENLMLGFYTAVKNSQSTASEENQSRQLHEEVLSVIKTSIDEEQCVSSTKADEELKNQQLSKEQIEYNNSEVSSNVAMEPDVNVGFADILRTTDPVHLPIIRHSIKVNVPLIKRSQFLEKPYSVRAQLLYAYHTDLRRHKSVLARRSLFASPLPKPLNSSVRYNDTCSGDTTDAQETYVSRSGRQTKRKIYLYEEDEDSSNGTIFKKVRTNVSNDEEDWLSKRSIKQSLRTPKKLETAAYESISSTSEVSTTSIPDTSSRPANVNEPSTSEASRTVRSETRAALLRRTSNTEIMRRSKLFADIPPKRRTRQEEMFDNLVDEDIKKKKQDKEMELFEQSLQVFDEDEETPKISKSPESTIPKKQTSITPVTRRESPRRKQALVEPKVLEEKKTTVAVAAKKDETRKRKPEKAVEVQVIEKNIEISDDDSPEIVAETEAVVKRRIVPTIPGRKGINSFNKRVKKDAFEPLNIVQEPSTTAARPARGRRRLSLVKEQEVDVTSNMPSSQKKVLESVECPLCNKAFSVDKVEEHAATCGETEASSSTPNISRITCEICDKVVALDENYEVHVSECLMKKKRNL